MCASSLTLITLKSAEGTNSIDTRFGKALNATTN